MMTSGGSFFFFFSLRERSESTSTKRQQVISPLREKEPLLAFSVARMKVTSPESFSLTHSSQGGYVVLFSEQ